MLIYHKTNNQIYVCNVMFSYKGSDVHHFKKCFDSIWEKHMEFVEQLQNDGDCYVTGATFKGAIYDGMWMKRDKLDRFFHQFKKEAA